MSKKRKIFVTNMNQIGHISPLNIMLNIHVIFLLLYFTSQVDLRPSTALDQPAGELEWEAWLLIHDSTHSKSGGAVNDETTLKRITPKSIFTVRPFSPDILPPCAEGYRSDAMGRCVKFIKIDQNSHLGFLVEKLNSMTYDEDDYDDSDEEAMDQPTAGPLQFNIPFGESFDTNSGSDSSQQNFDTVDSPIKNITDLTINSTLNIIPLPKEILRNLTPEIQQVNASERNETILSLLDELMQKDQQNNSTIIKNSTNLLSNSTSQPDTDETETIIILFHPLNSTKIQENSTTKINDEQITDSSDLLTTTEFQDATTERENSSKNHSLKNINHIPLNSAVQTNLYPDTNDPDDEEFHPNRLNGILSPPFLQNGDYKSSYFHKRWNTTQNATSNEQKSTNKQLNSTNHITRFNLMESITRLNSLTSTTTTVKPNNQVESIVANLKRINSTKLQTKTNNYYYPIRNNESTVNIDYSNSHRNRDRNIFWSNPRYAAGVPTERINSKYSRIAPSATSSVLHHSPYHGLFRKTLYADSLFGRRRWSNR